MRSESVDLTNCDREPIHIPGAIQPHGALVAYDPGSFRIAHVSVNIAGFLSCEPAQILGEPLSGWLSDPSSADLRRIAGEGFQRAANPLRLTSHTGRPFDGIVHLTQSTLAVLELEPQEQAAIAFHSSTRSSLLRLQSARPDRVSEIAASEIRILTGFDRVMVYRFDHEWNGEVVAEARRDDLEPFLGLHYPAADIPAQARRLYALNWLRLIPDRSYIPCALLSAPEHRESPLDLSFSVLRSVSPIHVEYLRNMGVSASMSISLVRDGTLIGLVACHHYGGTHHVPFSVRETCEFLAQVLSWHLTTIDERYKAERESLCQQSEASLLASIATSPTIPEGLCSTALLDLTGASGAALLYEGDTTLVGVTPAPGEVSAILSTLPFASEGWVTGTDKLSDVMPESVLWEPAVAGVLAVEISKDLGEYILWFKPPVERTVDWAGDPRKTETPDSAGTPRLSPRGSFALWREVVRGKSTPWPAWAVDAARNLRRSMLGAVRQRAEELRTLNARLAESDRLKDEFIATVGHELRTPLNAIVGWTYVLRQNMLDGEIVRRAIDTIDRNAHQQSRLVDDLLDVGRIVSGKLVLDVKPVSLSAIVESALDAMRPAAESKRIRLQSTLDSVALVLGDAGRLQQVVTNLLSNAIKFTPREGRVQAHVERRDSSVELRVADTGEGITADFLPHVFERFRQSDKKPGRSTSGLGLGLAMVRHLVELHGGSVAVHSEGPGFGSTFTVRLPLSVALRPRPSAPIDSPRERLLPRELAGAHILIVEDDDDASAMLKVMLEDCGVVVATAATSSDALRLFENDRPDLVVSDIGLPDHDGHYLIHQIRSLPGDQGAWCPAVALTAHARAEDRAKALHAGFNNHVPKPVDPDELIAVIAALLRLVKGERGRSANG